MSKKRLLSSVKKIIEFLKEKSSEYNNISQAVTKPLHLTSFDNHRTYKWKGEPDDLHLIYEKMKGSFIASETTKEQFFQIFLGTNHAIKPIIWISKPVLLAYFLDQIRSKQLISINTNLWAIAEKCFDGANKKNLSNSKQNYDRNKTGKPRNHHLIDDLFTI